MRVKSRERQALQERLRRDPTSKRKAITSPDREQQTSASSPTPQRNRLKKVRSGGTRDQVVAKPPAVAVTASVISKNLYDNFAELETPVTAKKPIVKRDMPELTARHRNKRQRGAGASVTAAPADEDDWNRFFRFSAGSISTPD